jgi:GxxExxY protein
MMKQEARKPGKDVNGLTEQIIGTGIQVHRELGPGYLEALYEEALAIEFGEVGIHFERQRPLSVFYRNRRIGEHRLDFLVENVVVVELKAVQAFEKVHFAIVRSYLKATGLDHGLLMNFAAPTLEVKRVGREFTGQQRAPDLHA